MIWIRTTRPSIVLDLDVGWRLRLFIPSLKKTSLTSLEDEKIFEPETFVPWDTPGASISEGSQSMTILISNFSHLGSIWIPCTSAMQKKAKAENPKSAGALGDAYGCKYPKWKLCFWLRVPIAVFITSQTCMIINFFLNRTYVRMSACYASDGPKKVTEMEWIYVQYKAIRLDIWNDNSND